MVTTLTLAERREQAKSDTAKAIDYLRNDYLKVGDRVYTILRNCGNAGMTRYVDLFIVKNNKPIRITWNVAKALAYRYNDNRQAIAVGGCGFNAGASVVENLAWKLFGNVDALKNYDF